MTAIRQEALLKGIEEIMKLHRSCISGIESMLPGLDDRSAGDWKLFAKTLNRHWRCWGQRASELRQQLFGVPKTTFEELPSASMTKAASRAQLEALLEQHRLQYSSLDSDAAASRDYRTMCIARTQLAEAIAFEEKLGKGAGVSIHLRIA